MAQQIPSDLQMEQARQAVNHAKQLVQSLDPSLHVAQQSATLLRNAESQLQIATKVYARTREKFKSPSRTKETVNPVAGIKRVLSVMRSSPKVPRKMSDGSEKKPLFKNMLQAFVQQAPETLGLTLSLTDDGLTGLKMECGRVFRAGLWFTADQGGALQPDCALVFGTDETLNRWRTSAYRVFGVLTERATVAATYFWNMESNAVVAVKNFLEWLALHKTIFSDVSVEDGRRLAFDASRGVFLPPCVRAFDGDRSPHHPRACIPKEQDRRERAQGPTGVAHAGSQNPQQQAAAATQQGAARQIGNVAQTSSHPSKPRATGA